MSRQDDTANTAMFKAFVDDDTPQQQKQGRDRAKLLMILAAVVFVVIAVGWLFVPS